MLPCTLYDLNGLPGKTPRFLVNGAQVLDIEGILRGNHLLACNELAEAYNMVSDPATDRR